MLSQFDSQKQLRQISIEIQRKQRYSEINKLLNRAKTQKKSIDPIRSSVYVDWQDSIPEIQRKAKSSAHSTNKTFLFPVQQKELVKKKSQRKNYSVQLPKMINKSQQSQKQFSSGRKSNFSGKKVLRIKKQESFKLLNNQKIRKYMKNHYTDDQSYAKKKGELSASDINLRKQLNLRNRVQEKIVKKKSKLRKKNEWVQVDILCLQTYFGKLKKQTKNVNMLEADIVGNVMKTKITVPKKQKIPEFIRSYKPMNKEIVMNTMIKSQYFQIIFQDEENLYFGQIKNNEKNGYGVGIDSSLKFEGIWKDGMKEKGIQITQKGYYKGQFKNNLRHGDGQFCWNNGQIYSGQWFDGKKHGSGIWKSGKGDVYIGQWKFGHVEGYGVHLTNKGQKYQGQFTKFLKNGQGKQEFPNGDFFDGIYKNGKPNGRGKYIWKNGVVFQGQFVDGLRCGVGQLIAENYLRFKGNFKDDLPNGDGQIIFNNSNEFRGQFLNGKKEGRGIMNVRTEKKIINGIWKDNELIVNE